MTPTIRDVAARAGWSSATDSAGTLIVAGPHGPVHLPDVLPGPVVVIATRDATRDRVMAGAL